MNKFLYRACSEKEYFSLLKHGIIYPKNLDFISLSNNINIANTFLSNESNFLIKYNKEELIYQGGIDIEYTLEFFKNNPELALHCDAGGDFKELVNSLEDQYMYQQYQQLTDEEWESEKNLSYKYLYESIIKSYIKEEEFVIDSIKFTENLIVEVLHTYNEYKL